MHLSTLTLAHPAVVAGLIPVVILTIGAAAVALVELLAWAYRRNVAIAPVVGEIVDEYGVPAPITGRASAEVIDRAELARVLAADSLRTIDVRA